MGRHLAIFTTSPLSYLGIWRLSTVMYSFSKVSQYLVAKIKCVCTHTLNSMQFLCLQEQSSSNNLFTTNTTTQVKLPISKYVNDCTFRIKTILFWDTKKVIKQHVVKENREEIILGGWDFLIVFYQNFIVYILTLLKNSLKVTISRKSDQNKMINEEPQKLTQVTNYHACATLMSIPDSIGPEFCFEWDSKICQLWLHSQVEQILLR